MTRISGTVLVALAILADQASKYWVEANLPLHQPVPLLPVLDLFRTYNTGIAFSMLTWMSDWALSVLTLFIVAFVLFLWSRTGPERKLTQIGFALVIGGALGNLIDRVILGHVIDFILVHAGAWSFAVFNLADSFISVGAAFIVLDELLELRRSGKAKV
jgi:signal peptidase II